MKYTAVRFTCFCVLFFLISARMAAAQEQQPSSTPATAAIAGATIAEWKGNIRLNDGSEVIVRAHTRLQVQQPSMTDPSYFQLLLGRIRALINKRTGGAMPFELGTPSAVIAVRGTQFDVEVNPRNVTEVDVVDVLVEVYGRNATGGSVLLEPGFSTSVGIDTTPDQPSPTNVL